MIQDLIPPNADASTAAVVAASVALIGVLFSAIVSAFVSRRSIYINAVTVERSKWIEKLRANLADFCAATSVLDLELILLRDLPENEAALKVLENCRPTIREIDRLDSLIKLQLNPRGEIDRNLITLLDIVPDMVLETKARGLSKTQKLIVLHSQWLLKQEWEKVKFESAGAIWRMRSYFREKKRRKDYRTFCQTELGSVAKLKSLAEIQRKAGQ